MKLKKAMIAHAQSPRTEAATPARAAGATPSKKHGDPAAGARARVARADATVDRAGEMFRAGNRDGAEALARDAWKQARRALIHLSKVEKQLEQQGLSQREISLRLTPLRNDATAVEARSMTILEAAHRAK